MQEQTMPIENALQILANVTGAYRGTRDEHRTIEAALNAVVGALQQSARPCEQKPMNTNGASATPSDSCETGDGVIVQP